MLRAQKQPERGGPYARLLIKANDRDEHFRPGQPVVAGLSFFSMTAFQSAETPPLTALRARLAGPSGPRSPVQRNTRAASARPICFSAKDAYSSGCS
jgi:hypothetical protein